MSARPPGMLTLATLNLSANGARVTPGDDTVATEVTQAAALDALKAFAGVPAVEFVEVDARIYLTGPRGKFAVQNIRGRLFVTRMPESTNTPVERTPEEIITLLSAAETTAASTVAAAAAEEKAEIEAAAEEISQGPPEWAKFIWVIAVLAVAVGLWAFYSSSQSKAPKGVQIIGDVTRYGSLHAEYDGRYGEPAATVLVLDQGHLTSEKANAGAGGKALDFTYVYGERDGKIVLVLDNGTLIEPQPDKSIMFRGAEYRRLSGK